MSWFGDGTFKQYVLDEITWRSQDMGLSKAQAAAEVAHVLAVLCETAFSRDEEIARVRAEAYEQAKRDLIGKLGEVMP